MIWVLYFIIAIFELFFEYTNNYTGILISKALLMPILMLIIYKYLKQNKNIMYILAALTFSWFGDMFLLKSEIKLRFILGLVSFLIAHLSYASYFIKEINSSGKNKKFFNLKVILPIIGYWILMLFTILPDDKIIATAIAIYATVILTMLYLAIMRKSHAISTSFNFVVIGALLFVISDSLIAFNKFNTSIPFARIWIMSTYILAQGLIIKGIKTSFDNTALSR